MAFLFVYLTFSTNVITLTVTVFATPAHAHYVTHCEWFVVVADVMRVLPLWRDGYTQAGAARGGEGVQLLCYVSWLS